MQQKLSTWSVLGGSSNNQKARKVKLSYLTRTRDVSRLTSQPSVWLCDLEIPAGRVPLDPVSLPWPREKNGDKFSTFRPAQLSAGAFNLKKVNGYLLVSGRSSIWHWHVRPWYMHFKRSYSYPAFIQKLSPKRRPFIGGFWAYASQKHFDFEGLLPVYA